MKKYYLAMNDKNMQFVNMSGTEGFKLSRVTQKRGWDTEVLPSLLK